MLKNESIIFDKNNKLYASLIHPVLFSKAIYMMASNMEFSLKVNECKELMMKFNYDHIHFT